MKNIVIYINILYNRKHKKSIYFYAGGAQNEEERTAGEYSY